MVDETEIPESEETKEADDRPSWDPWLFVWWRKLSGSKKIDVTQRVAVLSTAGLAIVAPLWAPREAPIVDLIRIGTVEFIFLFIAGILLFQKEKTLNKVAMGTILFIAIRFIHGACLAVRDVIHPQTYTTYGDTYADQGGAAVHHIGWVWFFIVAMCIGMMCAAIFTLMKVNISSNNFSVRAKWLAALFVAFGIIYYFWGTSTTNQGAILNKLLFVTDMPGAITFILIALSFVALSFAEPIITWSVAAAHGLFLTLEFGFILRFGTAVYSAEAWILFTIAAVVTLLACDELSFLSNGKRYFTPLAYVKKYQQS